VLFFKPLNPFLFDAFIDPTAAMGFPCSNSLLAVFLDLAERGGRLRRGWY
jgi:hypothetical protein